MIKVFNRENLKETLEKRPVICYYSENGACGPSGLFFVVFSDKSCYGYSTFYGKSDKGLINNIIEHVPELRSLVFVDCDLNFKRERYLNSLEMVYLGLGNYALIQEELLTKMKEYEGQYDYSCFKQLVKDCVDGDIQEIWGLVRTAING